MSILMIDNYDSFTYNLVHYFSDLGCNIRVIRNDAMSIEEVAQLDFDRLVISPGPRSPNEAGISLEAIKYFAGEIPILGVCLGHQAIGQVFGGKVIRAPSPVHGKICAINHNDSVLFSDIPRRFNIVRYHSLMIEQETFPESLEITAVTDDSVIMALQSNAMKIYGVQFHPESVASEYGHELLQNFLDM